MLARVSCALEIEAKQRRKNKNWMLIRRDSRIDLKDRSASLSGHFSTSKETGSPAWVASFHTVGMNRSHPQGDLPAKTTSPELSEAKNESGQNSHGGRIGQRDIEPFAPAKGADFWAILHDLRAASFFAISSKNAPCQRAHAAPPVKNARNLAFRQLA
jgi:hypothetical protein